MTFRHPGNGYTVTVRHSFLWCLIFGLFYFMKHSAWSAAIIAFFAAVFTVGLAWLIYPFFAKGIIRKAYLTKGWVEVDTTAPPASSSGPSAQARQADSGHVAAAFSGQ
jgi:peptidoglycan/LPS O-acetylase OafA/YrhL